MNNKFLCFAVSTLVILTIMLFLYANRLNEKTQEFKRQCSKHQGTALNLPAIRGIPRMFCLKPEIFIDTEYE